MLAQKYTFILNCQNRNTNLMDGQLVNETAACRHSMSSDKRRNCVS